MSKIDKIDKHMIKHNLKYLILSSLLIYILAIYLATKGYCQDISDFKRNNPDYKRIEIIYNENGEKIKSKYYVAELYEINEKKDISKKLTCVKGIFFKNELNFSKYDFNNGLNLFNKTGEKKVMCGQITILNQGDK